MDAGTPGEDAGNHDEDAGNHDEDAGNTDEDAGNTDEDAGTGDAGFDGGADFDGGFDGGMSDSGTDGGPTIPVVINEYAVSHNSSFPDGPHANEYIEIFGAPNTDYSDLTILVVSGNGSSAGRIDHVIPVGTTDAMGYWVFLDDPDPTLDEFGNSSATYMLVRGFTGALGDDIDADGDGALDATLPFTEILDSLSTRDGTEPPDPVYSTTVLARLTWDGIDSNVAAASRIPNGVDTDSAADWVRNDGGGIGLPGGPTSAGDGEGINTPGAENAVYVDPT